MMGRDMTGGVFLTSAPVYSVLFFLFFLFPFPATYSFCCYDSVLLSWITTYLYIVHSVSSSSGFYFPHAAALWVIKRARPKDKRGWCESATVPILGSSSLLVLLPSYACPPSHSYSLSPLSRQLALQLPCYTAGQREGAEANERKIK